MTAIMKVRGECTHISCKQPCRHIELDMNEDLFRTLVQQAPSNDQDHFLYKDCSLFNSQEFEILSIDGTVIAGRSEELLNSALIKNNALRAHRATFRNEEQERYNELFDIAKALAKEGVSLDQFSELKAEDIKSIKEGIA